jgi:NIMA (never in mitosis gene a)-related kinase
MEDKYEPISLIGKGNFGSITKIRRKSDGKILVWKELNYGTMKEKYKHHITSEINILKELHHPNIVKYYDRIIDKENTKIYIIMEYCPGGDLSQLIKRCRHQNQYINEDIIWKIFSQVVSALYACHTNKSGKILHRDIKPSNIFLDNDNNVKLGDFGLSLMLNNEMNFAYSNVGTPYYMSPEQVDENKYNEKSDIWSLGCFLYELTSLHPPFEAHNHLSLALKIKSGKIEKLPEKYSSNLCKVIFWMLNVDPDKRPSIKDIILVPDVNIRIKERKVKEGYQKLKKYENELKIREENLVENEKKLKMKEKFLDEREKNIIQRENYIKKKEEEIKYNNTDLRDKNKYRNNASLFITSGGFDIKGLDPNKKKDSLKYDSELNTIKNGPISTNKKYYNRQNMISMNELKPINIDKKYASTIRKSMDEEKIQYDFDKKVNNKENSSFSSHKLKTNIDINNNSYYVNNILGNHYNTSKNNINSINFNNSNNSLTKINSNTNILDNHSKIISFNSELNYSSNDEKVIKNNNINTSNINSLGFLSINSQENNMMINNNNNNSGNNINSSIRNNSVYQNRHSISKNKNYKENNKNSYVENNIDYKSGSTNYFSSIPRTSGDSYNENMSPENNMNINYNSFNVKKSQQSDNTNNYKDNYRLLKNDNRGKKSKQILNIEYNKKYDSEQSIDEYINNTKRNNKN